MVELDDIVEIIVDGVKVFSGTMRTIPTEAHNWVQANAEKNESFSGLPLFNNVNVFTVYAEEEPLWLV